MDRFLKANYIGVWLSSRFKQFSPLNNFYVFADPRGGSTWLAEIINQIPQTSMVWEPLHLEYAQNFKNLGFHWRQHIDESSDWMEAKYEFEKLFEGKTWNIFSARMNSPFKLLSSKRLIFKICRGNRLLPWLTNQFRFDYKPIYMVRHPFSVVASQVLQGGWESVPSYKLPNSKFTDFENSHLDFLSSLKTREEILVAQWCISNKQSLENARNGKDWIFITYEDLYMNTEEVISSIFRQWKLELPNLNLNLKSATALNELPKQKELQLGKWKEQFESKVIDEMMAVVDYFGIHIYSDRVLPIIPAKFG